MRTQPHPPTFEVLFDLEKIQEIQDSFSTTSGVASLITDPQGTPLTAPSNFCRVCRDMVRTSKQGRETCRRSDAMIGQCSTQGPIIRQCLNLGLWDAGVSMVVSGHHIATWLIGQVRSDELDPQAMAACARRIGVDEQPFLSALEEVPVMSLKQFRQVAQTLFLIANQLSDQAFQKFTLDQILAEKKTTEQALLRQNEYLAALHETSLGMFSRRKLDQVLSSIVHRATNLTGIPNGMVYLYDASLRCFTVATGCGKLEPLVGKTLPLETGISGRIWETAEPAIVNDYQDWPLKNTESHLPVITSAIGVPLNSGSRIEGGLTLCHHEPDKSIPQETCHILEQFAEIATLAADNANLIETLNRELKQRSRLETEQREMAAMLRQSQKLESIGTLAGGIAHDFNNILFPVLGFAQILLNETPADSPVYHQIQTILEGALRAKDLVNQILTFSRHAEQKLSPLKIQLILSEVLRFARASLPSTIKIKEAISKDVGEILADPTMVHQVAMNLITNALHAMEAHGGVLTVRLSEQEFLPGKTPQPEMTSGVYACLEISDTGVGMEANTMERIFEPYYTSKPQGKGTGLGLSVVHGVVNNLGGTIRVSSRLGKGSTFWVYFPVMASQPAVQPPAPGPDLSAPGNERILLVDDEAPVLDMLEQLLVKAGYQVCRYQSSPEALDCFKTRPHGIDLIITDMTMPEITGDKLIFEIKKIRPEIPVILTTGFSEKLAGKRT